MKEIRVLAFGAVADVIGQTEFLLADAASTDDVKNSLEAYYPDLKNVPYAIAVNKRLVNGATPLNPTDTVALLPPFSGG